MAGRGHAFPSGIRKIEAWSRSEWMEKTFPVWAKLCDPIAAKGVEAMGGMFIRLAQPGTTSPRRCAGPRRPRRRRGSGHDAADGRGDGRQPDRQALGELAREVVGSTDIGLPLGPEGTAALLPAGVAAFGQGLSGDAGEVRLYLALREAAHQRLFAHVPWLRAHLLGAVEEYASGITVDMARPGGGQPGMDLTNPEALQRGAAAGGCSSPRRRPRRRPR